MDIESTPLVSLSSLSSFQKSKLSAGGIIHVKDLILADPPDLARTLKLELDEVNAIVYKVSQEMAPPVRILSEAEEIVAKFTTGDKLLDQALGGGIRTGLLWEFCGEGSSGKTQLAMQLALSVQLPSSLGGLAGSACYINTVGRLHTERLSEMITNNPLFEGTSVDLARIHSLSIHSPDGLISVLKYTVPALIDKLKSSTDASSSQRLRLLVLDSITPLVRIEQKTSTKSLAARSKLLYQIAAGLRAIAFRHQVAIVIINEVMDTFVHPLPAHDGPKQELYQYQIKFISRAHSLPGEDSKEASLGLVWANQINARTMLTRTSRRVEIPSDDGERSAKRRRTNAAPGTATYEAIHQALDNTTLLRRMSVIFNPVTKPVSLDYIITSSGISGIALAENDYTLTTPPVAGSSGQSYRPVTTPSTNTTEDDQFWNEVDGLDGADESLFLEPETEDPLEPLDPQQEITCQTSTPIDSGSHSTPEDVADGAEDELWENMPDLSQYMSSDKLDAFESSQVQPPD